MNREKEKKAARFGAKPNRAAGERGLLFGKALSGAPGRLGEPGEHGVERLGFFPFFPVGGAALVAALVADRPDPGDHQHVLSPSRKKSSLLILSSKAADLFRRK